MHRYARDLQALLRTHANAKLAPAMQRYMRDQFQYLGIKSPQLAELLRQHIAAHGLPPLADLDRITRDLWALPQREFQYAATTFLGKLEKQLPSGFIRTLEYLIVTKSWWDTVDTLSAGTVGVHFRRYPRVKARYLAKWRLSKNFWLRRATLLFQLKYGKDTDFPLLKQIIRENLRASGHPAHIAHPACPGVLPRDPTRDRGGSQEFFINKAIGWALRQYTRIDPRAVRKFVAETPLHPLSAREAFKWLEKHGR
jgi:3-methyladenine DNA glycosylase AlkD